MRRLSSFDRCLHPNEDTRSLAEYFVLVSYPKVLMRGATDRRRPEYIGLYEWFPIHCAGPKGARLLLLFIDADLRALCPKGVTRWQNCVRGGPSQASYVRSRTRVVNWERRGPSMCSRVVDVEIVAGRLARTRSAQPSGDVRAYGVPETPAFFIAWIWLWPVENRRHGRWGFVTEPS